jgi:Uncharacterised nucleotidyltransferase
MYVAPEFRLFCLALHRPKRPGDLEALRKAAAPNWATILTGARRHRVAPLLLEGLQRLPHVPPDVVAELRQQSIAAAQSSLAQVAEISRLTGAFTRANIRVLALKGVVLSAQVHGGAFPRGARDIDLLVDPRQFSAAELVLTKEGYRSAVESFSPRKRASHLRWLKDIEYVDPGTGVALELHQRLADNAYLLPADFDTLWREREEVRTGNVAVATLSRRALGLYLCAHGAGHAWERLRWLVDLAALFRKPGSVDVALADADAAGLGPAMLHALMLAHDWLGLPVDQCHLARAQADAQVSRLDRILSHLYAGSAWHEMPASGSLQAITRYSLWQRLYRVLLKPDWRYRTRQIMREFFSPADFDTVHLPDALFFLYPVVRPVGWLARRWQR